MKIEVDQDANMVIREVFNGVYFETAEGNRMCVYMRDDTFEMSVKRRDGSWAWYRVNPELGTVGKP